ncbi:MAG: MFS transporter [Pseudohongiellaceae bacterium]
MSAGPAASSAWSPLRIATFRWLWLATLVSNIGSWMHEVGAGWLMTSLTSSPVMVALMQTATSLPAFFVLLPSGALSDIVDRRKYLLAANIGRLVVAALLAVMTLAGWIGPWTLLLLTLFLGINIAMIMPTWQAIVPEVVPREHLQAAIGLNTLGTNLSRVLGSLIAGVIIAASGSGVVFICNALSLLFIIGVLLQWKRIKPESALPPERFRDAVATGLRYARHSPALLATIYRSIGFYFFASILWALLPLIARDLLEGDERTYSYLFAAISIGAIGNAMVLPRLRRRYNNDQLITRAGLVFAVGLTLTATVHVHALAMLALCVCGAAWITVMACAQLSAQTALPNWIRSRGLAVFLTCFTGSLGIGPVVWGGIAELTNLPTAMLVSAAGLVFAAWFTQRWPVSGNDQMDHTPSRHRRKPQLAIAVQHEQGPVMVNVRYEVAAAQLQDFLQEIQLLGKVRRRDGASFWQIFEDAARPGSYVEAYVVASWLDHLRQHERISRQDARVQQRLRDLVIPGTEPVVTHYVNPLPAGQA